MRPRFRDLPSSELKPEMGPELKQDTAILFCLLEDDRLYTCATATATRIDRILEPKRYNKMRGRILSYATYRKMSESPDGRIYGNPAWFGKTFKSAMGDRSYYRAVGNLELLKALSQIRALKMAQDLPTTAAGATKVLHDLDTATARVESMPVSSNSKPIRSRISHWKFLLASAALLLIPILYKFSRPDVGNLKIGQEFDAHYENTVHDLPDMLASGANFTGYLPEGSVTFTVENLGSHPATVLMVYYNEVGTPMRRLITLKPGGSRSLEADQELEGKKLYFLSLQSFSLTTEMPVSVSGPPTRRLPVKTASTPATLRQIEYKQQVLTVGVDFNGKVHYPVFGSVIGRWNGDTLIQEGLDQ